MSVLAGREILRRSQEEFAAPITSSDVKPTAELESLTRDLTITGNIAMNAMLKKERQKWEKRFSARRLILDIESNDGSLRPSFPFEKSQIMLR
jgi:hypothetical protein